MSETTTTEDKPATPPEQQPPATTDAAASPPPQPPGASAAEGDKVDADRHQRRWNQLTARVSNMARERDELANRLAQIEAAQRGQAPQQLTPEIQAAVSVEAQRLYQAARADEKMREFHETGAEAYPDWAQRCQSLIAMGADSQLSHMLVELKDGHRIAAALHDAPEELERILSIRNERGRAVALGQFEERIREAPVRKVTKAPRPPEAPTGRVEPKFSEYTADAQALVQFYSKQALERRQQK